MANGQLEGMGQVVWASGPWMLAKELCKIPESIIQGKLRPDSGTRIQIGSLTQRQLSSKEYANSEANILEKAGRNT